MEIMHKGSSCTRTHLLWTLSWRGSPVEPKCLLQQRPGFKSWFCHPKLSRFSCLLQTRLYLEVCLNAGQHSVNLPLCTALCTFLSYSFLSHILSSYLSVVGVAILFCFVLILFESSSQSGKMWASLFWVCSSATCFLGFDSQGRNSVMLPWTWLNGCSGLADLWLFLPMFDLSKQTAVM